MVGRCKEWIPKDVSSLCRDTLHTASEMSLKLHDECLYTVSNISVDRLVGRLYGEGYLLSREERGHALGSSNGPAAGSQK